MQERHVFEYAVIRLVPRVEREEFLNIGVVLYCAKHKFLQMRFHVNDAKWHMLDREVDVEDLKCYLEAFNRVCLGGKTAGIIGTLEPAERFRWLTAARSTILQTSKVHLGLCANPEEKLDQLFEQLVL
ncbi:DUF3037 domain-containing protein [Olivibacter sp. XZL3]|uniref:DUF3037 domain-containing protein n=1 Tax=Olivibacter sp. XZL3 TaxID=1735116 RepID=UPI0010653E56|nr:DUF3037 domain-containing protein [Olivibacter sp. XZL3]